MIKVVVFDLDGVLVDTRELHYETLNVALEQHGFTVTREEHLAKYDGHPTKYKLKLLTQEKGLPASLHDEIWTAKQAATQERLRDFLKPDPITIETLRKLKMSDFKVYVASNSIWETVKNSLWHAGLLEHVDYFVSCEDVRRPKPSADVYFKCFAHADVGPAQVLVIEDSPTGLRAAFTSGAHVLPVSSPSDVTFENVMTKIDSLTSIHSDHGSRVPRGVKSHSCNIVVPMAGLGSRFASTGGYTRPKPLIDVEGKTMIQRVVENIGIRGRFIFIVQKEHRDIFHLQVLLDAIAPGCEIVTTEGVTQGAACSVLLAKHLIDNETPLVTANSDQLLDWDPDEFLYCSMSEGVDGCISTFASDSPKFSYARLNAEGGFVSEVAEKRVISEHATTGVYYWAHGSDFVKYSERMIDRNIRINNEFYVAPVYNQAIEDGKSIKVVPCRAFHCLGTPEDLDAYLSSDVRL
jgi:HAD superfamily hydrolase (TIGR01509 family)